MSRLVGLLILDPGLVLSELDTPWPDEVAKEEPVLGKMDPAVPGPVIPGVNRPVAEEPEALDPATVLLSGIVRWLDELMVEELALDRLVSPVLAPVMP